MALDLEATKEDIRHEYRAWFAELAASSQLYSEDNETFSRAARIVDLEARILAKVTDEHQSLAIQIFRLVQQWLERLDVATRRRIFEGGSSRQRFIDRVVQHTMCQMNNGGDNS
jgi:hypothetical protein